MTTYAAHAPLCTYECSIHASHARRRFFNVYVQQGRIESYCSAGEPGAQQRGRWNRETWQRGTISQGWTSQHLFQCSSRCSLQVCLIQGVLYELLIGFMFVVLFLSVLLIATSGRLSWSTLWTTFGRTINSEWLSDWLIDQFLKVFFVIITSSCILSTCSMSALENCTGTGLAGSPRGPREPAVMGIKFTV